MYARLSRNSKKRKNTISGANVLENNNVQFKRSNVKGLVAVVENDNDMLHKLRVITACAVTEFTVNACDARQLERTTAHLVGTRRPPHTFFFIDQYSENAPSVSTE